MAEENLFQLLERHAPDGKILPLIDATSVHETDGQGCSPLHYAARFRASKAVIAALLEAHPEAAKIKCNNENLPLHLATIGKASEEVVRALLDTNLEAAKSKDNQGDLPLHAAILNEV